MERPYSPCAGVIARDEFEALKNSIVVASRLMTKAEVLEVADALHDELRMRHVRSTFQGHFDRRAPS